MAMKDDTGWLAAIIAILIVAFFIIICSVVHAHDLDRPELNFWYSHLMQPDNPGMSCCGEADAYWCDDIGAERKDNGEVQTYCLITDERDDAPMHRPHIDVGTRVDIPNHKMKWGSTDPQQLTLERNPTGHAVVFLSRGLYVYCFVTGVLM